MENIAGARSQAYEVRSCFVARALHESPTLLQSCAFGKTA
jgi:hypothetical protein